MSQRADRKTMRLRYAGTCRSCAMDVGQGVSAVYERQTRSVLCLTCAELEPDASAGAETSATDQSAGAEAQVAHRRALNAGEGEGDVEDAALKGAGHSDEVASDRVKVASEVEGDVQSEPTYTHGSAGLSARREHDRRHGKRETAIRDAHPKLGGLILALSDDPQSTKAWARGAVGEERLGARLDSAAGPLVRVLHDRRIPRTKANIDHIVVCPSGVVVIDAKRYQGRPSLRVEGGILRPRVEKLMVGRRDCSKLVDGVLKQVGLVADALRTSHAEVSAIGMLAFVDADWPLIGGSFTTRGVHVTWPKKAVSFLQQPGSLDEAAVAAVTAVVAASFPSRDP